MWPHKCRPLPKGLAVDFPGAWAHNVFMKTARFSFNTALGFSLGLLVPLLWSVGEAKDFNPDNPLNQPPTLYWCPNNPLDRQYVSTSQPGCTALVEEEKKEEKKADKKGKQPKTRAPLTTQDIQGQVAKFLQNYRTFLNCCASDVAALDELEDLEEEASHILKFVQQSGFVNMGTGQRGMTLSQIIPPVAQARDDLRKIKMRQRALDKEYEKVEGLDYEPAAREHRRLREEEAAISKDFRPVIPPQSAPTGADIGGPGTTQGPPATTLPNRVGTTIEGTTLRNAFGTDIGEVGSPDSDQSKDLHPRMGLGTHSTTLPARMGTATQDTTLQNTTGFGIGAQEGPTGSSSLPSRAGPHIGDSTFNRR